VERDAKYAAVAAFALLALAGAFAFVWWYSGLGERRDYLRYEIYFDGSVSGLSRGSPVRYLGVDVGRVDSLAVDQENTGRIKVLADIDSVAPISGATRATLGLLGLTGLLYIDLQKDPAANADQPLAKGEDYPVIPTQKGDIEAFLDKLPDLLSHTAQAIQRFEELLTDENLAAVSTTLGNVKTASADLPVIAKRVEELTGELRKATDDVSTLARTLRGVTDAAAPQVEASLVSMRDAADKLSRTADSLDRIVVGNQAVLAQFAGNGVAELQQLVVDMREATDEIRGLARGLREQPSSLLLKPREAGMEIPP
jgi:phospholipid/cholesterol/gamma-HCH transport system substrate-binding protein